MICNLYPEPSYIFFTSEAPALLYYSHVPATLIALVVGLLVFLNNPKKLLNKLLFFISLCFSTWTLSNLILWTGIDSNLLMFFWTFLGVFSSLISILSIYFIYVFLEKRDAPMIMKNIFIILLLPVLFFAQTDLNVSGFNITDCDAFDFEGLPFKFYYTALGFLAIVWTSTLLIRKYRVAVGGFKKQILLMGAGIELFLISFISITFIFSYLANIGVLTDSRSEMFGLFGMTIFMVFIGILMVRYKTFNVGLLTSQALLIALVVLISSQFTFTQDITAITLTSVTLIITGLIGILLVRNVRNVLTQKQEIEKLVTKLEKANTRLEALDRQKSEFISIASHQLRSPLTSIRGYASLLLEGSYGDIPKKALIPIERIEKSSKLMALAIEDYLNVSRIESGNMQYNYSDFNLKTETEHICDDLRHDAIKKGLVLIFRSELNSRGIINADIGKTIQIIQNLTHNAIKYTKTGTVKVFVRDDINKKRIYVDIIDTGIGMNREALHTIFQKFERASNANSVNIHGTGLGLYVSLRMAEAMGGTITAHSEGDNAGSRFTLDLPLAL